MDIRRNVYTLIVGRAAFCLLDVIVIVSSVKLCDSKYGRLGGNVSAWQIGKGWFTPAPPRVKNVSRCPSALAFVTYVLCRGKAHLSDVHFISGSVTQPSELPT